VHYAQIGTAVALNIILETVHLNLLNYIKLANQSLANKSERTHFLLDSNPFYIVYRFSVSDFCRFIVGVNMVRYVQFNIYQC